MSLDPLSTPEPKDIFGKGGSLSFRLLVFVTTSMILMILDHRTQYLATIRQYLSVLSYPVEVAVSVPGNVYDWSSRNLASRTSLLEENQRLEKELLVLKARLQKWDSLKKRHAELQALVKSSKELGEEVAIAEILRVELDPYRQIVTINKGSSHDVFQGQAVIDSNGVAGQVRRVSVAKSEVTLITDPTHTIPIESIRTGLRTVAVGSSEGVLQMPYLPTTTDIKVGDLFVSSGLGEQFPRGYPVCRVISVHHDPGRGFANIQAKPIAKLDTTRELLLVWQEGKRRPNYPNEATDLEPEAKPEPEPKKGPTSGQEDTKETDKPATPDAPASPQNAANGEQP